MSNKEENLTLTQKLSKIQKELICKKELFNAFGKYNYRNLESIFDSLKSHLGDLIVTIDEDLQVVADRVYIKATAIISDGENKITATAFAREPLMKKGMSDEQITVSTSSYASKSAMQKLFMLDDTANSHDTDSQDNTSMTAIDTINKLLNETKTDKANFLKYFKVSSVSSMNYETQQKAIKMLEDKKGK